ncbi:MAG: hypothetical protein OEU92_18660 [Alphaproteobacteria bacterium]|nr:hypothetical protein [Alphaproteobacteria bacterium]
MRSNDAMPKSSERLPTVCDGNSQANVRAGAAGIGGSASSNAILRGLAEEAATVDRARQQEASQSIATINRNARNARRNNLLDLASGTARQGFSLLSRGSGSSLFDL